MAGVKFSTKNFLSIGFIINACENFWLSRYSSDYTRKREASERDPSSDIYKVYSVTEVTTND